MAVQPHHHTDATSLVQHTAPVLEFRCLYTADLRKKQKKWQDGRLKFHTFNKKIVVFDDRSNYIGDAHWRETYDLEEGCDLQLERGSYLVEVADFIVRRDQDLTELIDKPLQDKVDRARARATISSPAQSLASNQSPSTGHHVASPLGRPKPLAALLGTPSGHYGRATPSLISPYEQRQRELHTTNDSPRPAKRQRRSPPPTSNGYAQNLTGATLTLTSRPASSLPSRLLFAPPNRAVDSSGVASIDLTGEARNKTTTLSTRSDAATNIQPRLPSNKKAHSSRAASPPAGYARNLTGATLNLGACIETKAHSRPRPATKVLYPSSAADGFIDIDSSQARRSPSPVLSRSKAGEHEGLLSKRRRVQATENENIPPVIETSEPGPGKKHSRTKPKDRSERNSNDLPDPGPESCVSTLKTKSRKSAFARTSSTTAEHESCLNEAQTYERSISPVIARPRPRKVIAEEPAAQIEVEEDSTMDNAVSTAIQRIKSFSCTTIPSNLPDTIPRSEKANSVHITRQPKSRGKSPAVTKPTMQGRDCSKSSHHQNQAPPVHTEDLHRGVDSVESSPMVTPVLNTNADLPQRKTLKIKSKPKKTMLRAAVAIRHSPSSDNDVSQPKVVDNASSDIRGKSIVQPLRIGKKPKRPKLYMSHMPASAGIAQSHDGNAGEVSSEQDNVRNTHLAPSEDPELSTDTMKQGVRKHASVNAAVSSPKGGETEHIALPADVDHIQSEVFIPDTQVAVPEKESTPVPHAAPSAQTLKANDIDATITVYSSQCSLEEALSPPPKQSFTGVGMLATTGTPIATTHHDFLTSQSTDSSPAFCSFVPSDTHDLSRLAVSRRMPQPRDTTASNLPVSELIVSDPVSPLRGKQNQTSTTKESHAIPMPPAKVTQLSLPPRPHTTPPTLALSNPQNPPHIANPATRGRRAAMLADKSMVLGTAMIVNTAIGMPPLPRPIVTSVASGPGMNPIDGHVREVAPAAFMKAGDLAGWREDKSKA